jgi:hypothetical protein
MDGKTLRRSFDKAGKKNAIHKVYTWHSEQNLVLGQVRVYEKSNEITAIPALLDLLQIHGAIITIDAMLGKIAARQAQRWAASTIWRGYSSTKGAITFSH